jgi:putative endonuclease
MQHWTYIEASASRGALYIGSTANLSRRAREHSSGRGSAFTRKYRIGILVWYECFDDKDKACLRERTMKGWPREWKINLIERTNPTWADLASTLKQ